MKSKPRTRCSPGLVSWAGFDFGGSGLLVDNLAIFIEVDRLQRYKSGMIVEPHIAEIEEVAAKQGWNPLGAKEPSSTMLMSRWRRM